MNKKNWNTSVQKNEVNLNDCTDDQLEIEDHIINFKKKEIKLWKSEDIRKFWKLINALKEFNKAVKCSLQLK